MRRDRVRPQVAEPPASLQVGSAGSYEPIRPPPRRSRPEGMSLWATTRSPRSTTTGGPPRLCCSRRDNDVVDSIARDAINRCSSDRSCVHVEPRPRSPSRRKGQLIPS